MILVLCMSLATTKLLTRLTRTSAPPTLTRPMCTSRPVCNSFRMGRPQQVHQIRATRRFRKTCILKHTSLLQSTDLLLHNGVLLNHNNHHRVLHRLHWQPLGGIVLWLRSAIQVSRLSSLIHMSSASPSVLPPNTPRKGLLAQGRSQLDLMENHHGHPPMALVRKVLLVLRRLVHSDEECLHLPRHITLLLAHTMLHHNTLPSLLSLSRRLRYTKPSPSRIASPILTTDQVPMLAVCLLHRRLLRPALVDLSARDQIRVLSHPTAGQPALHQRSDPLSRTVQALLATATRALISTMRIPLLAVASQVVRLLQRPLLLQLSRLLGIATIASPQHHRSVTESGTMLST